MKADNKSLNLEKLTQPGLSAICYFDLFLSCLIYLRGSSGSVGPAAGK